MKGSYYRAECPRKCTRICYMYMCNVALSPVIDINGIMINSLCNSLSKMAWSMAPAKKLFFGPSPIPLGSVSRLAQCYSTKVIRRRYVPEIKYFYKYNIPRPYNTLFSEVEVIFMRKYYNIRCLCYYKRGFTQPLTYPFLKYYVQLVLLYYLFKQLRTF